MKSSNSEKGIKHHVNKRGNVALDKIQEAVKTIKRNANLWLCAVLIAWAVTFTSCSSDSPEVQREKLRLEQKKLEEKAKAMEVDYAEDQLDATKDREALEKKHQEAERDLQDAIDAEKKLDEGSAGNPESSIIDDGMDSLKASRNRVINNK